MASQSASIGHVRKRQFQPSITSYFIGSWQEKSNSPLSPPLPADTQASLLSVGMRVRKSVPEGYKTHKTVRTTSYPFPSTAPVSRSKVQHSLSEASSSELQPFCGLHKTGGWKMQDVPPASAPAALQGDDMDDDDLPDLIFSQITLPSTQGSFVSQSSHYQGTRRKRSYEDEIEEDMDDLFEDMDAMDQVHKYARTDRPIARMKPSLRKAATDGMVRVATGDDFDDATFLIPSEGMETDDF